MIGNFKKSLPEIRRLAPAFRFGVNSEGPEIEDLPSADEWNQAGSELTGDPHEASAWLAVKMAEFEAGGGTITAVPIGASAINPVIAAPFNRADPDISRGQTSAAEQFKRNKGREKTNAPKQEARRRHIAVLKNLLQYRTLTAKEVRKMFSCSDTYAYSVLAEAKE